MRGGSSVKQSQSQSQSQPAVVAEVADKEKTKRSQRLEKKERNRRRSNKNSSACNSVNEIRGEATDDLKNAYKVKNLTSSMNCSSSKQQGLDLQHSSELDPRAYDVAFGSMPTVYINKAGSAEPGSTQSQLLLPTDLGGRIISSRSCPEPVANDSSCLAFTNKDDNASHQSEEYAQRKLFAPHWTTEAVNEALEKGDAFKALFCVNALNQLEAYCKIGGVQTDVLINGRSAQNRAVEGDVVLIKLDHLSLWTKIKGFTNNSSIVEDSNLLPEAMEMHGDSCKGQSKVDVSYGYTNCTMLSEKGIHWENDSSSEAYHQEMIERGGYSYVNGHHPSSSDSTDNVSSNWQNEVMNAIERLSATISSYPTKRPTGRVVAIIERSPGRDGIVGFLNVNQWFNYKVTCKKDIKKNRTSLSIPDRDYIQLTPTDPKFPKMVVLVKDLPDSIMKRLEEGDATVEMELVAARIDEWNKESPFPQAHVSHVFGQCGEVEQNITAILYENAICSESSPESLSCLPRIPWEVPYEELYNRKDLRNLCIFTIDPSTAINLDDALSIEWLSDRNFRVGVHIADVSYFVLPDTALDREAQIRSTSVFMLQQKVPMLPVLLSQELCSLNPGVDRLAFSIFWDLNSTGDVVDRWIGRTVIRSCCKLSYEDAQDIIDGKFDAESSNALGDGWLQLYGQFKWADVVRSIKSLYEVSKTLKDKRSNDGALRLENSKPVFLFNEYGTPFDSVLSGRKNSNFLVEEFMLLANKTAADVISRSFPDIKLLRRHPAPNMCKLKEFEAFCSKHGMQLDTSSSDLFHQSLVRDQEKLKDDHVLFDIIMNYATRPMQLAAYFHCGDFKDDADRGHYALAVPLYTQFTSPLRRYPDIVVHRALAAALEAEDFYWKRRRMLSKDKHWEDLRGRCLTGIYYDKDAAESLEVREALSVAALKHGVPCADILANVAAYRNDQKLTCKNVKDGCEKLYMWVLLKKKEVLLSEARVMALGPRFMTIYIQKLATERRIYYDKVEGLIVEWLEATSSLVLNLCVHKRSSKRGGPWNYRALEEVALVVRPNDLKEEHGMFVGSVNKRTKTKADSKCQCSGLASNNRVDPGVFPLTVRLLSTVPVALHAISGSDGPLDIAVRLYMSSYLR